MNRAILLLLCVPFCLPVLVSCLPDDDPGPVWDLPVPGADSNEADPPDHDFDRPVDARSHGQDENDETPGEPNTPPAAPAIDGDADAAPVAPEVPEALEPDCNGNGSPDVQDLADGTSADCDSDGVPDECQLDSDGDGAIDPCDGCPESPDKTEPGACGCDESDADSDGNGTPDCLDVPESTDDASDGGYSVYYFETDGHAGQGFDGCFTAEGRIGSAAVKGDHTFELGLGPATGAPQNQNDFEWQNDCDHAFRLTWDGQTATFQLDDVVMQGDFDCREINALNLRCRANKGVLRLFDLELNGWEVPDVETGKLHGNALKIMRIEGDFGGSFTLTGTVRMSWAGWHLPKNSHLALRITAGTVADDDPGSADDCNGNGIPDDQEIADGTSADCDSDGVPDECQADSDADGAIDPCDGCPEDPDKTEPGDCGCGVADADSDGDGVPDCNDGCPEDPDKIEPGDCGCGVADADSDGDGVPDCNDGCPEDPDKIEPGDCGCGVADADSDGDGVPDCNDLCPDTPSGHSVDDNGCDDVEADAGSDVTLDHVRPVVLVGSATGGLPPYTYMWSAPGWDGSLEQSPTVLPATTTTYTLTVIDSSPEPKVSIDTVTVTINPPPADLQYTIVAVDSLSDHGSYPTDINDWGEVVGYYYTDTWVKHAFLLSGEMLLDIGWFSANEAHARDINNAGQVSGEMTNALGQQRAFLWDAFGGMQDLGTLDGDIAAGYGLNEAGDVAGYSSFGATFHAFAYRDGVMSDLGTLDYYLSGAFDLNDHGQVAGSILNEVNESSAFVYDNGELIDLGSPLLHESQALLINDAGLVAGSSWQDNEYRSFLYADGAVIDIGSLDGFPKTYVCGMNEVGQVVGNVTDASDAFSRAVLYTGGELLDLNTLLVPGHGWENLIAAYGINNRGQIVGYGLINGQYRGFIMTPVP